MKKVLTLLAIATICILIIPKQAVAEQAEGNSLVIADFETFPNNLGGEVGVYGSLEPNWDDKATPYSWYYGSSTPGYDQKNVHSGVQSFRLVNALGTKKNEGWGSFSMDLGAVTDATAVPKKVQSKNVMRYKYLTFWVKGERGGEKIEVLFRDSKSPSYMPSARYKIKEANAEWEKKAITLEEIHKLGVDLKSLDSIGIAFGPDVGNKAGAIIYIDDFIFTDRAESEVLY